MSSQNQYKISSLIAGSIAVTVGLAWNNAITALINYYVPQEYTNSKNAWMTVFYAIILTVIASFLSTKLALF